MSDALSICPFCSLGCVWRLVRDAAPPWAGEPGRPSLDYAAGCGPNRGSLCAKGNMSLELMTHPHRLEEPRVREAGRTRAAGWAEAVAFAAERLGRIRAERGPDAVGLLLGPQLVEEEAVAAIRLAHALGTPHVDLCEPEDHALTRGLERSGAVAAGIECVAQLEALNAALVVGDLFSLAPSIARSVLDARYRDRRHLLAVLAPTRTRTAWFGRPALRCAPGAEAAALALLLALAVEGEGAAVGPPWTEDARRALPCGRFAELEELSGIGRAQAAAVVRALRQGPASAVLVASEFGGTARLDLVAGLAALLAEAVGARFLALLEGANSVGIRAALAAAGLPGSSGHTAPELLEAAVTGDVQALLVFGADPIAAFPGRIAAQALRSAAFVLVTAALPGAAVEAADLVLPSAVFGEKAGTVRGAFGTASALAPVMPPPGHARPDLAILEALTAAIPAAAPPSPAARAEGTPARDFLAELDLFLRSALREEAAREPGTHLLLAEASATNAAEGSLTGQMSWARYAYPEPLLGISPAHARALGVRAGERVRVRSNWGEAELAVRIDAGLPEGVVTAPHRDPAVRALLRWRREPAVRSLDLRPDRVSLARRAPDVEVEHA